MIRMSKLTLETFTNFVNELNSQREQNQKNIIKLKKKNLEEFRNSEFGKVYNKLTIKEKNEYSVLMFFGQYDYYNNVVIMGFDAYDKVKSFEEEMINKYSPKFNPPESDIIKIIGDFSLYRDGGIELSQSYKDRLIESINRWNENNNNLINRITC